MPSHASSTLVERPAGTPDFGAFVVSLDFELHWGVRDHARPDGPYRENLLGARRAVPRMLAVFERHGAAATWATVGFLFARSREERERFRPAVLPAYSDRALDAYCEPTGENEQDDPLHYASSLIDQIRATPGQEVGSHTFSHYYCLEPGQTREAFAADLRSASAIALRQGLSIRSIVFPRNQWNPAYSGILKDAGIIAYRGPQAAWKYRARPRRQEGLAVRAARCLDSYVGVSAPCLGTWSSVIDRFGLGNVPASMFLRPCSRYGALDRLRFNRIRDAIGQAATRKRIFHLWWHPHNMGVRTDENVHFLESVLNVVDQYRDSHGLRCLSMTQTAEVASNLHIQVSAA